MVDGVQPYLCRNQKEKRRLKCSVAMVQIDVFKENGIILLSKFVEIERIFDKMDKSENQGVIYQLQSIGTIVSGLFGIS